MAINPAYDGAKMDNPALDYSFINAFEYSEDYHMNVNYTLTHLRQISQDMIRNNWLAAAAQQAYIDGVVGGDVKIRVECTDKRDQATIDRELDFTKAVDYRNTRSLTTINEELVASAFADGDVLINLVYCNPAERTTDANKDQFQKFTLGLALDEITKVTTDVSTDSGSNVRVQLIEGSRIKTRPSDRTNPHIINGVEFNEDGTEKGFWVFKYVVNSMYQFNVADVDINYTFVPTHAGEGMFKHRVAYLFKAPMRSRGNMVRQYPVMTPIFNLLRYMNNVLEAVLVGARVAACFTGFIKTSNPAAAQKSLTDSVNDLDINASDRNKKITSIKPGSISYLRKGEEIQFGSPNRQTENFDQLLVRCARFVASYFRIPYEILALDLSITNFSSWKGGTVEQKRNIQRWRRDLIFVNKWIINNMIYDMILRGKLRSSVDKFEIQVRFPQFESISPEETARANKINVALGTTSKQKVADDNNVDYDELRAELKEESEYELRLVAEKLKLVKELEAEFGVVIPDVAVWGDQAKNVTVTDTQTEQVGGGSGTAADKQPKDAKQSTD